MREDKYHELKELSWRRRLTASELAEVQDCVASNQAAAAEWRAEEALNRALGNLPVAHVSSNFTARVMAAVQRAPEGPSSLEQAIVLPWFFRGWWPRVASGLLMASLGFFSVGEYHAADRARAAQEVAAASRLAALPPLDWLKNFETIRQLDRVKVADDDLLSVLE